MKKAVVAGIKKSFRGGTKEHNLVILIDSEVKEDSFEFDDIVEDAVTNWGESDPGGANYGYEISYKIIKDQAVIKLELEKEMTRKIAQSQCIANEIKELEDNLKSIV